METCIDLGKEEANHAASQIIGNVNLLKSINEMLLVYNSKAGVHFSQGLPETTELFS